MIEAHIAALNNLETGTHQIINLGSGEGYSVKQVIDTAAEVTGRKIPMVEVERRAGDPAILVADISKAESQLGWRPTRNLTSMIEDTYNASK